LGKIRPFGVAHTQPLSGMGRSATKGRRKQGGENLNVNERGGLWGEMTDNDRRQLSCGTPNFVLHTRTWGRTAWEEERLNMEEDFKRGKRK